MDETQHYVQRTTEQGIHEFVFLDDSKTVVDGLFDHIATVIEQTPPDGLILYLLDVSEVKRLPPFAPVFRRSREFDKRYSKTAAASRFAIVHSPGVLMSLVEGFVNTLSSYTSGRNQARFFRAHQRDEALAWLESYRT